jgi:hypothetical protein
MKLFEDHFVQDRKKALEQTGEIRCAMDHILEAERKGEINHDNVLYIVENINVAGKNSSSKFTFLDQSSFLRISQVLLDKQKLFLNRIKYLIAKRSHGNYMISLPVRHDVVVEDNLFLKIIVSCTLRHVLIKAIVRDMT